MNEFTEVRLMKNLNPTTLSLADIYDEARKVEIAPEDFRRIVVSVDKNNTLVVTGYRKLKDFDESAPKVDPLAISKVLSATRQKIEKTQIAKDEVRAILTEEQRLALGLE